MSQQKKIEGFDFLRSFAILIVFLGHSLGKQCPNSIYAQVIRTLSPGLTMSLMGFISGYLLSSKYQLSYKSRYYIKRFTRIYLTLFICLFSITIMHFCLGKDVVNQHSILHFMGLSAFFDLFHVVNKSSIGIGLWFITVIVLLYLVLPLLSPILKHKNGLYHLITMIVACTALNFFMSGTQSSWNVIISFLIGVYIGINSKLNIILSKKLSYHIVVSLSVLLICALATKHILPCQLRSLLFAFYPIFVAPALLRFASYIPRLFEKYISFFSNLSFEFYIVHFYFINNCFHELFPSTEKIYYQIIIAFLITLPLSFIFSKIASHLSKGIINYFLEE